MEDPTEDTVGAVGERILAVVLYTLFLTLGAAYAIASRGDPVTFERVLAMLWCSFN